MKSFLSIEKLDRIIFGFLILFVSTLNNSIFLCQLGFFGAYLLTGYRFYLSKENPFKKAGLEKAFLVYFSAALLAAFFSVEKGNAFVILTKHLLLLPIVYLIVFAANTGEKAKTLLKFYLGVSLATLLVYLFFSLKHYFTQLYQLELKGPSPFQYVMTAGGLMSLTAIFFFAFFLNEKANWKVKLFYFFAFGLSFAAVIASYTRAAWLGLFAGLFVVLLLKKKWWIILPGIAALVFLIFSKSNESKVQIISAKDKSKVENVTTNGRAYSVVLIGADTLLIADYEKGIAAYKGRKLLQTIPTEAPITRINFWKENYYLAYSLDSRFFVVEKEPTGRFKIAKNFISPGTTRDFAITQEKLYVADKDSGLTIYSDPAKIEMKLNFSEAGGIATVDANEKYVAQYFENEGSVKIFTVENGSPVKMIDSIRFDTSIKYLWFAHNILLFQNDNNLSQYKIENEKVSELKRLPIVGITRMKFVDTTAYALTIDGKIFVGTPEAKGGFAFNELINLGYPCTDFDVKGEQILVSSFKRNRILSIFDPNHETNFERLNIWRVGLKIFKDYPVLGVGDIDLGNLYRKYKDSYLKENFGHLHNNFMQWLVTLGVVGFSAVMFLMVGILLMHWKIYLTLKNEPVASSFAIGAIAAFIGFLASGLGEYNFGDQEIITMVWFTVGLNLAFYLNYQNKTSKVKA